MIIPFKFFLAIYCFISYSMNNFSYNTICINGSYARKNSSRKAWSCAITLYVNSNDSINYLTFCSKRLDAYFW